MIVKGAFGAADRGTRSAVGLAVALQREGVDVVLWPDALVPPVPLAFAKLLTKDPRGPVDGMVVLGKQALPPLTVMEQVPRHVVLDRIPAALDMEAWPARRRMPGQPLVFGTETSGQALGPLLDAWADVCCAEGWDATLQIAWDGTLDPPPPGVTILGGPWSHERRLGWLHTLDVWIETPEVDQDQRVVEMCATGGTAIIAGQWLHRDVVEVVGEMAEWSAAMFRLWQDRSGTASRGWAAGSAIRSEYDWSRVARDVLKRLERA